MKKVYQTIIDSHRGDCLRATIASLFELEIEQVPHFILYKGDWFEVYWGYLRAIRYDYCGCGFPPAPDVSSIALDKTPTIKGAIRASVKSRTFEGSTHAVLINRSGTVIHDPNPNKAFLGVNVMESGELTHWEIIKKWKKA